MESLNSNRRGFLKLGSLGALFAFAGGLGVHANAVEKSAAPMIYSREKQKALLLSSSRYKDTGYLAHAVEWFKTLITQNQLEGKQIAFIPYAAVNFSYDQYESNVKKGLESLDIKIVGVHRSSKASNVIEDSSAIFVGGGNTFKLVHDIYANDLMELVKQKVSEGVPYAGWSAGSNVAGATMMTTNDMPIIEPQSFNTFNIFPHQINPHFISGKPAGHNGESREDRLNEFLTMNQSSTVYALPEGTALFINGADVKVLGANPDAPILKMAYEKEVEKIAINSSFRVCGTKW